MKIPDGTSKTKVRKLDGFNKDAKELVVYLIGQLGKNEKYSKHIEGRKVLNYALHTIYKAYEIAGVRVVLVECQNEKKLMRFYTENGFEKMGSDLNTELLQFIRTITTEEVAQAKEIIVNTEEAVTRLK